MSASIRIAGDHLAAEINPLGAELVRLQDEQGRDLMWDGNPAIWNGRAPLLFPIVGGLAGGTIRVGDADYPLPRHGFARRMDFTPAEQGTDTALFRLEADAATRMVYPFDFRLDMRFTIAGTTLLCEATLHNPGDAPLPASFGYHPAFLWPLPWGGDRADHRLRFDHAEPASVRRVDADGLLRAESEQTPVTGTDLPLRDALFADDALIFDRITSRKVRYGVAGGRQLEVRFPDMPLLGIWTKPGAGYLCIEPWQGIADPAGYAGQFRDKPGVVEVAAGSAGRFTMEIDIGADNI
ncbi:aldose 1-epimerase family protein [uncultured Sphingomonas sp.]|uniref:aldose 1-epimerase family protein n=1 Tax=uncultured Sphingomonas sp. TaxID=158754 RepID=UPI0025EEA7E7|nr:aldose 1-epimerase family protein [uncultured Sphingomonas sp.]